MNYYCVSFNYQGIKGMGACGELDGQGNEIGPSQESIALSLAEKKLADVLIEAKIESRHQYSWPDGSLFKNIRGDFSKEELRSTLKKALDKTDLSVAHINSTKASKKTFRGYTLEEEFIRFK